MGGRNIQPVFRQGNWQNAQGWRLEHTVRKMMATLERRMRVTGQKFGRWTRAFEDGTRIIISANLNGVSPVFHANVIPGPSEEAVPVTSAYMESGVVGFLDFLDCGSGGDEGELYFNGTISAWSASRIGSSLFSYIGEMAVGTLPDFSTYPPLPSTAGSIDQVAGPSQAFSCARAAYKDDANAIPASIFSGKYMRMLVQGKYGRKDTNIASIASTQAISIDSRVLSSSASSTHGIYVYEGLKSGVDVLEYWLMNIANGVMTVGQLTFPSWADSMIQAIIDNGIAGGDRDWLETWILAFAEWPTEETEVATDLPTINPLSYGWRFKNAGTQAKAITVSGGFTPGYSFETATVNISLTYTGDVPSWGATGSTATHATDVRFSNHLYLWALNGDAGYDPLVSSNAESFAGVPVFGWYSTGDVWQTETLDSDGGSGVDAIAKETRDVCNSTFAGECFFGHKRSSSSSRLSSASSSTGTYNYTSTPGCGLETGVLVGGGEEAQTQSGWRGHTMSMGTDICDDKPDYPSCATDPVTRFRYKMQGFKEELARYPSTVSGSYTTFSFLAPARGDCNKCYVGSWTYYPSQIITIQHFKRRKFYQIEPLQCWDTEGAGSWYDTGWSWKRAVTAGSAWQVDGPSTQTDHAHAARELQVRLVGDNTAITVFDESGTSDVPETVPAYVGSSLSGRDAIDLTKSFVNGGWGPYIAPFQIGVSSLFVKQSAVEGSLAYVPNPGGDYTFVDDTWEIPTTDRWLYVGGS